MPPKTEPQHTEPDVHQPAADASGAIRTDRPHTPEEAAAADAANRETLVNRRKARFAKKGAAKLR